MATGREPGSIAVTELEGGPMPTGAYATRQQMLYFGRRVRSERHGLKLSQEVLAERMEMSRSWVASVETGRLDPPLHLAQRLAEQLGTTVTKLVRGEQA